MTEPEDTPTETNAPEDADALTRPQRRLLRRLFNGRTQPLVTSGGAFMTFREASRFLLTLEPTEREAAYLEMKAGAASRG